MYRDAYVIMPVFNEEQVVGEVIKDLRKYFAHVICVDDGSLDGSAKEILKAGGMLVQHERNQGQGAALRSGIEYALSRKTATYFVTFDADGQHDPVDAVQLVKELKKRKLDIVLGSRFLGSAENMGIIKRLVLKLAVVFMNRATGVQLTDAHNGLRAFNRNFAERLRLRTKGMAHASEFIYRIKSGHFSYGEAPVTIRYTDYSKAKGQSIFNAFAILKEMRQYRQE